MDARVKKAGEIGQDNLIAGIHPPAEVTGIKIAAGQGKLARGTVLAPPGKPHISSRMMWTRQMRR